MNIRYVKQDLKEFNFRHLFVEELGWDNYRTPLEVVVDGETYTLQAVAEKRDLPVYVCPPLPGRPMPDHSLRAKIETQVARSVREHLIIFTDADQTRQIWQWVRREPGKPVGRREHHYHISQSGQSLIQKLQAISFSLDVEEELTLVDVLGGVRAAFDVERVTRRFYDRFKTERDAFHKFLKGIPDADKQRWYVSVMLNRLMFIYFIQKKGFLNRDDQYLRHRLAESQAEGQDRFYRDFLRPLFFDGLAKRPEQRPAEASDLLGQVPYLNGSLFLPHPVEQRYGDSIQIGDAAFDRLFDFFEGYHWHLDERPLHNDNEINPDVLGYIFEKYINQKQMGAYYTREDITGYIGQNTIIPFLFDQARKQDKIAFEGEASVWDLLVADPDRYIYEAMKKGVDLPLPQEIAAGLDDVSRRAAWNQPAPGEYALPTEIWRETVARRQRVETLRAKLAAGEVRQINDLITYNLDIRQFAQDVIESTESPDLLRAFYRAIERVSVLDPTVGSGAFLFAALNILEPLYEACLERMASFIADYELTTDRPNPARFKDFRQILDRVREHPNRRYFIFKSIIVNNLFGVDIMEEAVEICKLRLFLKLVAQVDGVEKIEPLPDIDFNIRAGNTLVGYATVDEVRGAITSQGGQMKLLSTEELDTFQQFEQKVADVDRLFQHFRRQQTELGGQITAEDKQELRRRLQDLETELNRALAIHYGFDPTWQAPYQKWLETYEPFHWFIEFYNLLKQGGFDVIIGNPPYVEYSKIKNTYALKNYDTIRCGNLYAFVMERGLNLLGPKGRIGLIVPISSVSTPRMSDLMNMLNTRCSKLYVSNYAVRPGKLFEGVDMNLSIHLAENSNVSKSSEIYSTNYQRWPSEYRSFLFHTSITYHHSQYYPTVSSIPKFAMSIESRIWNKIIAFPALSKLITSNDQETIFVHSGGRYFRKCILEQLSNEYKPLSVPSEAKYNIIALLSSSLYYWFWLTVSDTYHVTQLDINVFHAPPEVLYDKELKNLGEDLLTDLWKNAIRRERHRADGTQQVEVNFLIGKSKSTIDKIDRILAKRYGFTEEELDFIINYDIKYRMGDELVDDEDEENEKDN